MYENSYDDNLFWNYRLEKICIRLQFIRVIIIVYTYNYMSIYICVYVHL